MNNCLILFVIIFAWSVCDLQDASANIRIVRSSNYSSRFVHHDEEEKNFATLEPSEIDEKCIEDTVNASTEAIEETTDGHRKRRGHEYVATKSLQNSNNFMKEKRSGRRKRNDKNGTRTSDYRKKFSDDLSDKIQFHRVVRRKHNGIVTEASSDKGEFIENIRADRLEGRRQNSGMNMDTDMYSDEFLHCNHIAIEKADFEKLLNGSVYVSIYEKLFTPREYYQNEDGIIFVCPTFFKDFDSDNDTETNTEMEDMYSEEFINCMHTEIEKGCFEVHPNGSVYVPLYKRLFTPGNYYQNEDGVIFVCPIFFEEIDTTTDKFPRAIYIVTLIGTIISAICVIVHIAMFLLLEKLRNLPGYCLFSMCIALMVAYICTFIPYFRKEVADCTAVGVIKAYGFLASFFWMNVMAYDIWRSLRLATAKLRLSGQRPMMTRFAMYSTYSWGCPLVIIIIGFIVNSSENSRMEYRLEITDDQCWFKYKQANLVYFAGPLFAMIILNVLMFVSSFVMISSATMNTAENKADLWSRFLVSFRLAVVMGLMWIFGVLAPATEAEWLWYFFVIFNVLQGMFIFFSFTFTEKTRKEARKALTSKKSSVFPTMTTSSSHPSTVL